MHAVDADVHQRAVGEGGVEGVFDDARAEPVVARGVFAEAEHRAPHLADPRERLAQPVEGGQKRRAHRLQKQRAAFIRGGIHLPELAGVGGGGLFAEHVLSRAEHPHRLRAVQSVGARDVDRVHLLAGGQLVEVCEDPGRAPLGGVFPPAIPRAGADRLQPKPRDLPRCRQEPVGDEIGADYSKSHDEFPLSVFFVRFPYTVPHFPGNSNPLRAILHWDLMPGPKGAMIGSMYRGE